MPKVLLTEVVCRNAKPEQGGQTTLWDTSLPSFGLRLSGKAKTFLIMVGPTESRRRISIGRYPIVSLAQARAKAKELLAQRTLGIERREGTETFDTALAAFLEVAEQRNKPRTVRDYRRLLTRHGFGKTRLSEIGPRDVQRRLDCLKDVPSEQDHAHVVLQTFFRFCVRRHYLDDNPMARLQRVGGRRSRARTLADDELRQVWAAVEGMGHFACIVRLCVLTGQRRSEVAGLRWDWIDEERRVITLPAQVVKNGREHPFPYGELTAALLAALPRTSEYVFPARKDWKTGHPATVYHSWNKDKAKLDQRCPLPHWVLHDLRRTFSTGLAGLGVPQHITERLLNHATGQISGVAAIYNRHQFMDEMRDAVAKWDGRLQGLLRL